MKCIEYLIGLHVPTTLSGENQFLESALLIFGPFADNIQHHAVLFGSIRTSSGHIRPPLSAPIRPLSGPYPALSGPYPTPYPALMQPLQPLLSTTYWQHCEARRGVLVNKLKNQKKRVLKFPQTKYTETPIQVFR